MENNSRLIGKTPTPLMLLVAFLLICTCHLVGAANVPTTNAPDVATDIRVSCNSDEIVVQVLTRSGRFNGMIYPRGLSKSTSCMGEWKRAAAPVEYTLPLRGCNTMSSELDDGGVEYFNTIVVQPHLKLVTNQGKGFHIKCRYNAKNNTIMNDSLKVDLMTADPVTASLPMPGCSMKIFSGDPKQKEVAENVKIGDPLTLVVALDLQDAYGIWVTDCLVRDGLGWGEQKLINEDGCPTDPEIMGMFEYSEEKTKASVYFQAHKFPYTASVYYQCNVKLCLKADNGCDIASPKCATSGVATNRVRRQAIQTNPDQPSSAPEIITDGTPATIEVFSGLYVNEANDLAKAGTEEDSDSVFSEKTSDSICVTQKNFAIGICIAGLILMLCVIAAILCLLARRRTKTVSHSGSSIYSGPYTNTAYSHSS